MRSLFLLLACFAVGCSTQATGNYEPLAAAIIATSPASSPLPNPTPPAPSGFCTNCNGKGKLGDGTISVPCPVCGGDGRTDNEPPPTAVASTPSPADYPHRFVPSVDSALLCDTCGESEKGGNHARAAAVPPTMAEQMLAENNRVRALAGKPPQTLDPRLCQAAQEQVEHLVRRNYQTGKSSDNAHECGNGTVGTRAARYGFHGNLGENFALNRDDVYRAFWQWQPKQSPGHARTLYGNYDLCGFGVAEHPETKLKYWMAVYGTEGEASPAAFAHSRGPSYVASPQPVRRYYTQPQPAYRTYSSSNGPNCGRRTRFGRR